MADYNTKSQAIKLDRNLALETVRVTEAAAIAAFNFMGGGDEKAADEATLLAIHRALQHIQINGTVSIGENEKSEISILRPGDKVGVGEGVAVDVATVPLEGKSILARGGPNALSLLAMAESGGFLRVPDVYMEKIAVGTGFPSDTVDLDSTPAENLSNVSEVKGCSVCDLVVCLLDRPRNADLITKIRRTGAKIRLILDGDVSGAIQAAKEESGVDLYMGVGGAQEGVLAAAALRGMGGQLQGRIVVRNADDKGAIFSHKELDPMKKYSSDEMAFGYITFAATGITYGPLLEGVQIKRFEATTHSMVVRSQTGTIRYIKGHHKINNTARL